MAMEYKARQIGNVTVLDVHGRISLGEAIAFGPGSGMSLQQVVRDFARRGQKNLVLNLTDVSYIDSSGIGELVGSATTLRKGGGDFSWSTRTMS
jgi:anti-sigma B factor antagonist